MRRKLLLAASVVLIAAGCRDDRNGSEATPSEASQADAAELRHEAARLGQLATLLEWYARTDAESGHLTVLLDSRAAAVSRQRLIELLQLEASPHAADSERRRLRYLRLFLTNLQLLREAGRELDGFTAEYYGHAASRPDLDRTRLADLPLLLAGAVDRRSRQELQEAHLPRLRQADSLLRRTYAIQRAAARKLGVTLLQLDEERDETSAREAQALATRLARSSKPLYEVMLRTLGAAVAPTLAELTLADLFYLRDGGKLRRAVAARDQLAALQEFLGGIGLRLHYANEREMRISTRGSLPASVMVSVPDDVRLAYRPEDGLWLAVGLFEAAGAALCQRANRADDWELRHLGPMLGPKTVGLVFGLVWLELGWWQRYNEVAGRSGRRPLSAEEIFDLVQMRIFGDVFRLRLQGIVAPLVRASLQGGSPATLGGDAIGPLAGASNDPAGQFAGAIRKHVGVIARHSDGHAYVHEVLPFDGAFDVRAMILAHLMLRRLRESFGAEWYLDRSAGGYLLGKLCVAGPALSPRELLRQLGFPRLDSAAVSESWRDAWDRLSAR